MTQPEDFDDESGKFKSVVTWFLRYRHTLVLAICTKEPWFLRKNELLVFIYVDDLPDVVVSKQFLECEDTEFNVLFQLAGNMLSSLPTELSKESAIVNDIFFREKSREMKDRQFQSNPFREQRTFTQDVAKLIIKVHYVETEDQALPRDLRLHF